MLKLGLPVCVAVLFVAAPSPATPPLVGYQGRVLDALGAPVNGNVALGFALFAASAGGPALWSETHPSVGVVDGVYNVDLGSVVPLDPALLAGPERWLEVTVNGETLAPRQRFTSAPYALRAGALDAPALPSFDALRGLPCNLGTPGAGTLTVTYATNETGAVSFGCTPNQSFLLSVSLPGASTVITSTPPGITCSTIPTADCSEIYLANTSVVLLRGSSPGCTAAWGGACSGSGSQCTVLMDGAKSVSLNLICN